MLIAGSDYELFTLDTPSVSQGELEVLLASRIRTLYPGNPDSTVYASLPNIGNRKNHIVVVMQKKVLESYRKNAKQYPLLIAATILQKSASRKGRWIGLLWSSLTVELCHFEDEKLISYKIHQRSEGKQFGLSDILGAELINVKYVSAVVSDDAIQDLPMLQKTLTESKIPCAVTRMGESISHIDVSRKQLFSSIHASQRKGRYIRSGAVASLFLITCALILFRYGNLRERDLIVAKALFSDKKEETAKIAALMAKIHTLEAASSPIIKTAPSAYEVLGAIASCLYEDCRITTFELNGTAFKFEAEASNSLSVLQTLEASNYLTAITLHSASRISSGKERFSISGSFNDAGQ